MTFEFIPFEYCGIVKGKIPKDLFYELKSQCLEILFNKKIQKPVNHNLAGNIKNEFDFYQNQKLNSFLLDMAYSFYDIFDMQKEDLEVTNVWVNFQQKHEFNPLHSHSGILSFVLWIQIPYDLITEKQNLSSINSNDNVVSDFYYVEPFSIKKIFLSKENEGNIIMFHSSLKHGVHPFYTSDDYRISIAGNLNLKETFNNIN